MAEKLSLKTESSSGAWYSLAGPEDDVVLSTRVRLARNLVNFPFPSRFSRDDGERVQSLVFDAFSHLNNADRYQALSVKKLEPLGQRVLVERGILTEDQLENPVSGIVIRTDGKLVCTINSQDHVRIAAFASGLDVDHVHALVRAADEGLQERIQFAASIDFGYLTASVNNLGTGMRLSLFAHLPSTSFFNQETRDLTNLFASLEGEGLVSGACFGRNLQDESAFSPALGACYQISTALCFNGSEVDQIAVFKDRANAIIELERMFRRKITDTKPTALRDLVYKALASVKYSRFLGEREAIDLLFRIKWGRDSGILSGIENWELGNLLYRIREAHINFVNRTEHFKFETDVNTANLQIERLRSLVMQETVENVQIYA